MPAGGEEGEIKDRVKGEIREIRGVVGKEEG
jgi:hypothetical protein